MIKHKWENNKCKVCAIEKHVYKELNSDGTKHYITQYHKEGEIVSNTGCIKIEKPTAQLKLFQVPDNFNMNKFLNNTKQGIKILINVPISQTDI